MCHLRQGCGLVTAYGSAAPESLDLGAGVLHCRGVIAVALVQVVGEVEARGEDVLLTSAVSPAFQSVAQACPDSFAYRSIMAAFPDRAIAHGRRRHRR